MPDKQNDKNLSFISNWQARAKQQQHKHRILVTIILIVVSSICIALLFWYRTATYDRILNLNRRYIQDSALQETDKVEREMKNTVRVAEKYAMQYVKLTKEFPSSTVQELLGVLWDGTLFDRIGFISLDGHYTSLTGECDVSDRDYFQNAINGKSGYAMIEASRISGTCVVVFYAPIYVDEEMVGIMAGFNERSRMDSMISYSFLNFKPNTYLIKRNGDVVVSSKDEVITDNMLDVLSQKKFVEDVDYNGIIEAIEDENRTSITFSFADGKKTSVGVISQFESSDWMILSVLPHEVTSTMLGNANSAGNVLIIVFSATFLILILTFIYFIFNQDNRLDTEMTLATDSLNRTTKHDQRQTFIVESLGNTYSSVYFINIAEGTYEMVNETDSVFNGMPNTGVWKDSYGSYLKKYIDPAYHDEMEIFLDTAKFEELIGESDNIGMEYQRADKGWRKAVMIPAERDSDGRVISVIFAVQRIESQKKKELETQRALKEAYEAAQLASKAKTTFLSNMSHDIRTPMNAIVGMTAIASANIDNKDKVTDCLKKISSSSKHLLGLINEVLDMSKIESGKVDLNEMKFSLSDLIDELITMNQPLIKEKGHSLMVKVNNLVHEKVIGDSTRLQQVFTNLLTNAIKYTPNGGDLEILVSEKVTNKTNVGWYEVRFKDNGIGMSEEFQKNIFDPFSRAEDTRLNKIQGTGLGMAIARNIIRMMNGDITVESELNKGSTFTVTFVLKLQNEEELDMKSFTDLPILVVDDEVSACEITCAMLDSLSMQSEWVTNGRDAVKKTVERHKKNDDYYAIIMDWKMPDMNGIETTREIRKRVGNEVPIIVLTAYDFSEVEQEAKDAGVNAFLSKPLFKSRVIDLFSDFVGAPKAHEENDQVSEMKNNDFSGKRILLAEDNELNSEIAVEILTILGLSIDTAANGKLCYEKLMESPPGYYDLIFMDIQMPVMNGYEAAKTIRASEHPDAKSIPIIAMTANAFSSDVRAAFDSGMNGHISKPIDINAIVSTLKEYFE